MVMLVEVVMVKRLKMVMVMLVEVVMVKRLKVVMVMLVEGKCNQNLNHFAANKSYFQRNVIRVSLHNIPPEF